MREFFEQQCRILKLILCPFFLFIRFDLKIAMIMVLFWNFHTDWSVWRICNCSSGNIKLTTPSSTWLPPSRLDVVRMCYVHA